MNKQKSDIYEREFSLNIEHQLTDLKEPTQVGYMIENIILGGLLFPGSRFTNTKLKKKLESRDRIRNQAIEEASKGLDKYFPKRDKRRGEALAVFALAFTLGFDAGEKAKKEELTTALREMNYFKDKLKKEALNNLEKIR